MHPKATVNNVTSALVEDLIRSLAARLEMHWDSLIEEEHGSPEGIQLKVCSFTLMKIVRLIKLIMN